MIRGSDGLEYDGLGARLRGEPRNCLRNGNILSYRASPRWTEEQVRGYIAGFDEICPDGDPGPSPDFAAAHFTGLSRAGKISPGSYPTQPLMKAGGRKDSHDQRI